MVEQVIHTAIDCVPKQCRGKEHNHSNNSVTQVSLKENIRTYGENGIRYAEPSAENSGKSTYTNAYEEQISRSYSLNAPEHRFAHSQQNWSAEHDNE